MKNNLAVKNHVKTRTKPQKRRRGRPPLPPEERRERLEQIAIRLSEGELAALERAAGDEPLATWCRAALLRATKFAD